jgi:ribosomal protein S18 acetylase RimI-like enzyme
MIEPAFHIRQFRFPQDVDAARVLWENSAPGVHLGRSDEPGEIARKLQRDPDLFLVAESDGHLIGTVIGGYDGRRGMVYHLAVHQAFQGLGIGGALMEEVERLLTLKGCMKAYLMVTPENLQVIDFYNHRGWSPMPITILAKELR